MKKNKNLFELNKQKVASLEEKLSIKLKGGSRGEHQLTSPTDLSQCFVCEDNFTTY